MGRVGSVGSVGRVGRWGDGEIFIKGRTYAVKLISAPLAPQFWGVMMSKSPRIGGPTGANA
ncbi:MAG: hypothetical protein F6J90_23595 [Moorea sp. SIOASIH]|nr:hypothetical protein [Moorena sp. SIOASIH]